MSGESVKRQSVTRRMIGATVACVLPIGVFLAAAGVMSIPPNTRGIDIAEGRDLFRAHCGSCHFAKMGFPAHHGPNLHEIGRTGARRREKMSAPAYILESVLDPSAYVAPSSRPGMPQNVAAELAPEQLRNIIGFLSGRGAHPDYEEIAALEIPDRRPKTQDATVVRRADMEHAVELMRTKAGCLHCHSQYHTPESKVFSPGIFHVGLTDRQLVRESISNPNRQIKAGFHAANVVLKNGKILTGRLLTRNSQYLLLSVRTPAGTLDARRVPLTDVEHEEGQPLVVDSVQSIMPSDFGELLTNEEMESIVTLIRQLN